MLGSGGREHALGWKLAQSPLCDKLWAAPGNPGIAQLAECTSLDATDHDAVIAFAKDNAIGLVVIGPEAPLVDGLADSLRAAGIDTFGPSKQAAQLEGSKGFTKELCQRAGIPTARYERCTSLEAAWGALKRFKPPFVLKADGLAAGKGVVIAETYEQAQEALGEMFDGRFGSAGSEVVIEQFLTGEEASFFALTDGTAIVPIGTAQDHKRVGEGDTGPNTGGMGAYSPAPVVTESVHRRVMDEVILPTVRGMAAEGHPYTGFLYVGLMIVDGNPYVIEFNVRMGDPETQVVLPLLKSSLFELLWNATEGKLKKSKVVVSTETAVTVVLAADGYPGKYKKGMIIKGLESVKDRLVFHAGTLQKDHDIISNGGRILNVVGFGKDLQSAIDDAYAIVESIEFSGKYYRKDIGKRGLQYLKKGDTND